MTCAILGDSIAVGVGHAAPQCHTVARVGISSRTYVHTYAAHISADQAVISLGANDFGIPTIQFLREMRSRVAASSVYWLVPNIQRPDQLDAIRQVAHENGDKMLITAPYVGPDGLHPTGTGYREIARSLLSG